MSPAGQGHLQMKTADLHETHPVKVYIIIKNPETNKQTKNITKNQSFAYVSSIKPFPEMP